MKNGQLPVETKASVAYEVAANDSTLRCEMLRSLLESQDQILVLTVLYLVPTVLDLVMTILYLALTVLYAPHSLVSGTP